MATLDYILGNPGSTNRRNVGVAPAPIDEALRGAPASVGSEPSLRSGHDDGEPSLRSAYYEAVKAAGATGMKMPSSTSRRMSYVDLFKALNPDRPETAEERARREKREKSEKILSAVGDGISALTNLFFTTRYAPNAYNASQGLSAKAKERWDRLRQEREANRRAYTDGYLRALAMDEAGEREDRNWRHTLERDKIADGRYEAQAERDKARAELDEQLRRHQITAAEHKAEQERIAALFAEDTEKLKQENLRAGVRQKNAAAGASKASAAASFSRARYYDNGGAGGGKSGPTLQLEEDEPMHFGDDKDYDRAVMRLAPDYGVPTTEVQVIERNRKGIPKKQRTIQRPVKDIAADIEREAAKRKKSKSDNNVMPGVGGGGSSNKMPGVK